METKRHIHSDLTELRSMFAADRIEATVPNFRIAKAIPCRFDVKTQEYIATAKSGKQYNGINKRIVIEQAYIDNGWHMVKEVPERILLVSKYLADELQAIGEMCLPMIEGGMGLWLCYAHKDAILTAIEHKNV